MSWPEGVDVLAGVMKREQGGDLAVVAAVALGQSRLPNAERPLVKALADGAPDLRIAAAAALGRVGSAAAVLPLKQAEARHEHDGAFRRAARQAIAEIQARIGAAPGQLSLTPSTGGMLSLVHDDDEQGRLSLDPLSRR
jgi:HEAT repeat protein